MTKFIAHRGNIFGPAPRMENSPDYILNALSKGFDVEIDVWYLEDKVSSSPWFLGHDKPLYNIPEQFLEMKGLWIHAKNIDAIKNRMVANFWSTNMFWHESDKMAYTTQYFIWTADLTIVAPRVVHMCTVAGVPSQYMGVDLPEIYGVCSDYIQDIKQYFIERTPEGAPKFGC